MENVHETTRFTENHIYGGQDLEVHGLSAYDSFSGRLSLDRPSRTAVSEPMLLAANNVQTHEQSSTNDVDMNELWLTSTDGIIGSATDISQDYLLGSELGCASLSGPQPLDCLSNDFGLSSSLLGSEAALSFLYQPLISDVSGAQLRTPTTAHAFNPSALVNQATHLGVDSDDTVIPHGPNETTIKSPVGSYRMTSAQASLFGALLSLGEPLLNETAPASSSLTSFGSSESRWSSETSLPRLTDPAIPQYSGSARGNEDPECIESTICGELVLDRNLESNSLPFVLHSYAVWMRRAVFDPSRAAPRAREYVVRHFVESEKSRFRTILIANIFRSIAVNPIFDLSYLPQLSALRATIQKTLAGVVQRRANPSREIQIRESVRALEQTLELFAASRYEPLHICLRLMREAAPVFRLACPEPMDQLVRLPGILMHPNTNMRHYPVMDVYFSIITGLPTNLKYDTSLRTPIDTSVLYIENHLGLSWLYGQPDRVTLILARINSLYQEFGTNMDARVVKEIEQDIQCFKANYGNSPDPSLLVTRLIVQECWRQVAYIYLYMTLCDTDVLDSRVRTAQQRLMKLVNDTKSTPSLDMHIAPCLGIAGVVTRHPTERAAMLLRLRGLPECSRLESCFSSCVLILEELWRQTDGENRPAKWSDFRLATLRVLGLQSEHPLAGRP